MNYLFILVFIFLFQSESFAQNEQMLYSQRETLKHKSRTQKIAGFATLGTGSIITILGISKRNHPHFFPSLEDLKNKQANTAIIIGSIVAAASIPLFLLSYSNAKKANSIEITNQAVSYLMLNKRTVISQPAIALKISF